MLVQKEWNNFTAAAKFEELLRCRGAVVLARLFCSICLARRSNELELATVRDNDALLGLSGFRSDRLHKSQRVAIHNLVGKTDLNLSNHIHPLHHGTEDHVLVVQPEEPIVEKWQPNKRSTCQSVMAVHKKNWDPFVLRPCMEPIRADKARYEWR